jgi:ERI1 exoribonuclease 3
MANKLRYLLVLDFEATCGERGFPRNQMEVIEFPTIVYDLQEKKEVGRFHEYVKPVIRPQLTEFCTQLTGITQVSFCFWLFGLRFKVAHLRALHTGNGRWR